MSAGAELHELDVASLAVLRVAQDLADERRVVAELMASLADACGVTEARRACSRAGEALVPALRALSDTVQRLSDDAGGQAYRFRAADGAA